jgi:DNA-binding CsgD family transcriptional regulator
VGSLATVHGDYANARAYLGESLSIWQEHGDMRGKAYALSELGWLPLARDNIAAMRQLQMESLDIFRAVGDRWGEARALGRIGWIAFQGGDTGVARHYFVVSIARYRPLGDKLALAEALRDLGELTRFEGVYEEAAALYQETVLLARELGNLNLYAQGLGSLAAIALAQDDVRKALVGLEALRIIVQRQGNTQSIYSGLAGTAGAAIALGHPELAARLYGAAEIMRDTHGLSYYPADQARYERDLAAVRRTLDAATLHVAWKEGRELTPEQAVALAEAVLLAEDARTPDHISTPLNRSDHAPLSRREYEVVREIVQGKSNREIAAALFIAEKTVEMHVSNSIGKLGFRARTQLASWATARETAAQTTIPATNH